LGLFFVCAYHGKVRHHSEFRIVLSCPKNEEEGTNPSFAVKHFLAIEFEADGDT